MFLKLKKCDIVIQRPKMRDDKSDWDDNDLKAINFIYSAISYKQLEFVCKKTTEFEIMTILDLSLQIIKIETQRLHRFSDLF